MRERLLTVAKWAAFPAFYLLCLILFGYLTFPYDRLKHRLIAEFDLAQQKRGGAAPQRLEIDELGAYWFSGVEVKGARLILPPSEESAGRRSSLGADALAPKDKEKADGPKPTVIEIDEAHARVKLLPLLIGRVRVTFWASLFGGEVEGLAPLGKSEGAVEVEVSGVDLSKVAPLSELLGGMPVHGAVAAKLELEAPDGKFNKANGSLELTASEVSVGDGKTKIQGLLALPEAKLGDITLSAEAKDGVLKVTKLTANGVDLELAGDGKFNVREPWQLSSADVYLRFKFSDAYRTKNDATKSLLGEPGSTLPALMEVQQPKMKRAKRADGFYGWHVHGQLKKLKFDPHAADSPAAKSRGKSGDSPFGGSAGPPGKKIGGLNLPLGPSDVRPKGDDEAAPPPPPPQPMPMPEEQPPPPPQEPPVREPPPPEPVREPPPPEPVREPPPPPQERRAPQGPGMAPGGEEVPAPEPPPE